MRTFSQSGRRVADGGKPIWIKSPISIIVARLPRRHNCAVVAPTVVAQPSWPCADTGGTPPPRKPKPKHKSRGVHRRDYYAPASLYAVYSLPSTADGLLSPIPYAHLLPRAARSALAKSWGT